MQHTPEHKPSGFRDHWKKVTGLALLLVACEPGMFNPMGTCKDVPACSAIDYDVHVLQAGAPERDSTTGHILVPNLDLSLAIDPRPILSAQTLCPTPGRSGMAYALSCAPCAGPMLVVDSLYFTTDIRIVTGDTLKAGFNFVAREGTSLPPGFSGSHGNLTIQRNMGILFRDSVFEVRFAGTADTVRKTGSTTLRITNPALLYP